MLREKLLQANPRLAEEEGGEQRIEERIAKLVGDTPKLIADLEPKKNYIVHYRLLQKYKELGMVIDAVHRVVRFRQAPWMKDYIDYNTLQRAQSDATDFEKEFYKLMNNR